MNKWQREVLGNRLASEETILKEIRNSYKQALKEIDDKVAALLGRLETEEGQINKKAIDYQLGYQKALQTQIKAILETMNTNQFETISEYLKQSYEDGFIGTMYDLQKQGVPLTIPMDQQQVVRSIKNNSKLSKDLWGSLAEDNSELQVQIRAEISRGISQGRSYSQIARQLAERMSVGYSKTARIVRTESHRISQEATLYAQYEAKDKGADIVKQWDSTLDRRTRSTHAQLDGQIREIDEPFEYGGHKAMHPSGFGVAALDINCRCVIVQRAKWALDEEELKVLEDRAKYFGLEKAKDFDEYKKKYIESLAKMKEMEDNDVDLVELNKQLAEKQKRIKEFTKNPKLIKEKREEFDQLLKEAGEIQKKIFKIQSEEAEKLKKETVEEENSETTQLKQESAKIKTLSRDEARTIIDELRKNPDKYTREETLALTEYTTSSYEEINAYLRGEIDLSGETGRTLKKEIRRVQTALKKSSVAKDMVVFRGTTIHELNGMTGLDLKGLTEQELKAKIEGKTYVKRGFTSTSINQAVAEEFTKRKFDQVIIKIILPEKSQALYVEKVSAFPNEQEMLIQNNAKLTVFGVEKDEKGKVVVNCKVVGYEE